MLLYGGGGHAKVIIDCLLEMKEALTGVFDDRPLPVFGSKYLGKYESEIFSDADLIISIGDNQIRKRIACIVSHRYGIVRHPSSIVSGSSEIGEGSVIFHHSIIQADTVIGSHCILNTASVVEHDCRMGDFAHLATNATLCGGVQVGEGTLVGAGATILPKVKIGKWCVIGAGSVVNKDVPDFSVIAGVPAKLIRIKNG